MIKTSDLREKEVINVRDGSKLGLITDIEVDLENSRVKAIIMPGPGRILGLFGRNNDVIIEWKDIRRIGKDTILVDLNIDNYSNSENDFKSNYE